MIDPFLTRREFAAACLASAVLGVGRTRHPARTSSAVVLRDVMVTMRDGVRLATDVYLPADDGTQFPVILERTPYDKTAPSRSERTPDNASPMSRAAVAEYFVQHGYAVVYQDCRGRYGSGGDFVKYLSDGNDGYDTCAWLLRQPWCNGRIGTMGLSYAAHTQAALACAGAPGVAAMFLDSGGFSNAYQGGIRQGGAFELKQATWAFNNALRSPEVQRDPGTLRAMQAIDLRAWFRRMPWKRGDSPVSLAPEYEDYLFEQWEQGTFGPYWKQLGIYAAGFYDRFVDAPQVHMSSWFDPYTRTATENYMALKKLKRGPVRLILGPWTHGDRQLTYAGDVDFGPDATFDGNVGSDFLSYRRRWFDRWLRGEANGVDEDPPVLIFVMGGGSNAGRMNAARRMQHGGRWRAERDWPLPGTRFTPFHFHRSGELTIVRQREDFTWDEFVYDPADPVPTVGGSITSGRPIMEGGAFDQREDERFFGSNPPYRPLAERPDVLTFQTEPLVQPVEVTGPIVARLWVSSDCPDTDFTIKLIDVYPSSTDYPDGFAMNLTDGILRMRYRDSWERPRPMRRGAIYAITVEAFPTSNVFARGHRIRVDISSSNYPKFDLNPNTGEPEGRWTRMQRATNRVYLDRPRPSHIVLPLIFSR